jgi:hypothetical protein
MTTQPSPPSLSIRSNSYLFVDRRHRKKGANPDQLSENNPLGTPSQSADREREKLFGIHNTNNSGSNAATFV